MEILGYFSFQRLVTLPEENNGRQTICKKTDETIGREGFLNEWEEDRKGVSGSVSLPS